MRIALIGPRAAGKSTVGRLLAERAELTLVDTDERIVERAGRTIAELFADGSFREREQEAVAEALALESGVVALGGGAVLWDGIEDALRGWGVVQLTANVDTLAARIRSQAGDRPSLTGAAPDAEVAAVVAARKNRYSQLSDFSVATDIFDEGEVARRILAWWRNR